MSENIDLVVVPPYSNTGVMCTLPTTLIACVDWVSVTFKKINNFQKVCTILGINELEFTHHETGFSGYKKSLTLGNIMILYEPVQDKNIKNMGVHLTMSGQGCREYEQRFNYNLDWSLFFKNCLDYDINFTRLDIAIDDYIGKYFTLKKIISKIKKKQVVSLFKTARNFEEFDLHDGTTKGQTVYFGKSEVMFRFYDKLAERKSNGYIVPSDIEFWNRYEIQLRSDKADSACRILAYTSAEIGIFAMGIFKNYLNFKIENKTDSNKRRWQTCTWWESFLGDVEKISLTQIAPDPSVVRTKDWIDNNVSSSISMLARAFDDDDLLFKYIKIIGDEKLSLKQKKLIDNFRDDTDLKSMLEEDMQNIVLDNKKLLNAMNS